MEPFVYQADCLAALETERKAGRRHQLVVMATGLGKTALAGFDLLRLLEAKWGRVLYLCHQTHILEQAKETLQEILGPSYQYGDFTSKDKYLRNADILFATFQTMANHREGFARNEFTYVIVDEVHHAQAETFRPTIEYFDADYKLGLTATLKRTDGLDVTELFEDAPPTFTLDLYEALAEGFLCDVDYRIMTDELQIKGVLDTPVGRLNLTQLNRTVFVTKRDEAIAETIMEKAAEIGESAHIMTFCASVLHADKMAALLPSTSAIHNRLPSAEKDARLAAFRTGQNSSITTVDMFNEGINVPEVNVVVFLRSTTSETIFLQQLGRGLRKTRSKNKVLVLDFVANCERIEMIRHLEREIESYRKKSSKRSTNPERMGASANTEQAPLLLTLDGNVAFEEEAWQLLNLIDAVRNKTRRGYSREELIEQLKRKAGELGRVPTGDDLLADPLTADPSTFWHMFGSHNKALAAAGLETRSAKKRYSHDTLVQQLQSKARELGRTPTIQEVAADPLLASPPTFRDTFGSYTNALKAAGLKRVVEMKFYTRQQLLAELQAKAADLGRAPTVKEVNADEEMAGINSYFNHFGSYKAALKAAGLNSARDMPTKMRPSAESISVKRKTDCTPSELLEQVLVLARQLGRAPRANEVDANPSTASAKEIKAALRAKSWAEVVGHIKPFL